MSSSTAPLIPAVKFVDVTKVFGLATAAGDILYGQSDGSLTRLAAGVNKSTIMYGGGGTLSTTTAPTFAGVVTGEGGLVATAGGVTASAGGVTATAGNIVAAAGSVSASTTVTGGSGVVATTGDITAAAGNLVATLGGVSAATTIAAGSTVTGGTGVIASAGGLQAGGITVGAATRTVATTNADLTFSLGSGKLVLSSSAAIADSTQLATKSYVDSVASGLDVKASVRTKTAAALPSYSRTANVITASSNGALAAVGGVTLAADDRLLIDQLGAAAGADAGIYVVTAVGDGSNPFVLTRASDANTSALVTGGMFTFIDEGTFASQGHVLTTNDPITLNTTALVFTQFSGSSTAPGASGDVILNSSGVFGVDTGGFTYTGTGATGTLTVGKTVKSVSGQPLALYSHLAGGSVTADRVNVGVVTNQGTTGDSVAFGLSSAASAAEAVAIGASSVASAAGAIALGAAASAVIADTFNVAAIPIGRSFSASNLSGPTDASAAPVLATSMSVLSTGSFSGEATATAAATLEIPAGALFFPMGAIVWCSSRSGTASTGTYTVTVHTKAGSGASPLNTELASIDVTTPPASVGVARIQWSTSTNIGVTGTIEVDITATADPTSTYDLRAGLIGFLIENE